MCPIDGGAAAETAARAEVSKENLVYHIHMDMYTHTHQTNKKVLNEHLLGARYSGEEESRAPLSPELTVYKLITQIECQVVQVL